MLRADVLYLAQTSGTRTRGQSVGPSGSREGRPASMRGAVTISNLLSLGSKHRKTSHAAHLWCACARHLRRRHSSLCFRHSLFQDFLNV